ncbi:MAG: ABC transporter ATP-binding protein [Candidatus Dormiibacterota bacterium]
MAERITAGYGRAAVVQDVSISAAPSSVVAVVGPNGAGKSTFMKSLFGLLPGMTGRVEVDGKDVSGWPPHRIARQGMAYVPQVDNVFPSLSVVENLEMGAFTRRGDIAGRIREVLGIFPDLADATGKRAGTLSGGQRNLLGMARSLMLDPRVVLLDEPTAGLSPAYTEVVWTQVQRIAATEAAVVVVEQNVDVAIRHADRVYVLVAGRNRLEGTAADMAQVDLASVFLGVAEGDQKAPEPAAGGDDGHPSRGQP